MDRAVGIIFEDFKSEYLFLLRDNKNTIPFPNQWDMLGGAVESDESFEEAITREMKEELELDLKGFELFKVYNWPDRDEAIFYKKINLDIDSINLHEGQKLKYFSKDELLKIDLAFQFNQVMRDFFESKNVEKN